MPGTILLDFCAWNTRNSLSREKGARRLENRQALIDGLTTGIHRLSLSSYSYSPPSSVSSTYLLSTLEKDIRGSSSNSEGDLGNVASKPSLPEGLPGRSMLKQLFLQVNRAVSVVQ